MVTWTGNVTIDPKERAKAAFHLEIEEVRSRRSGRTFDARRFIERQRYDRLVRSRNFVLAEIHRKQPRLLCAVCSIPVYLVASKRKAFFFRHRIEDGSCPAVTRSELTRDQIRAMKYLGARESDAHVRMKGLIQRSLIADPEVTDVKVEEIWRSSSDPRRLRRPDVQATFRGLRLAFEAQLSTTFLDVVVGRREFYRDNGSLLIWVLRRFDPEDRRMTVDDIFFMNNSNILIVDDETVAVSMEKKSCVVRCFFREPFLEGGARRERWLSRLVSLSDLVLDVPEQRAFFFDFQQRDHDIHLETERRIAEQRAAAAIALRKRTLSFWIGRNATPETDERELSEWQSIRAALGSHGVDVPYVPYDDYKFQMMIFTLVSIKEGKPIGSDFNKLVQVAHNIAEHYKDLLLLFGWALRAYGRVELLKAEDKSGKWRRRSQGIGRAMRTGDPAYTPYSRWDGAILFLFPELAQYLQQVQT